jgi:hypothetical protein
MTRFDRLAVVVALVCAVVGLVLGQTYIPRLPHHDGYFLVPVEDEIRTPLPQRPRHTVFILVDGLRRDSAETMTITKQLAARGQCRVSNQGSYTVSRPVYSLLSTGLEVDRHGSRNNELTTPLAAESIWQVARESGLHVSGSSHLPWFKQLFPGGFDRYAAAESHEVDVFDVAELTDVNLFHPLYVDEAGHHHGGASPEYAAAVQRADREIARLLARLDLERDLVVLTADHGHRDEGGHGGAQPVIANVLLCFAGPNVVHTNERRAFDGRSTAGALAVLLGIRFPRHMRAIEDGLDAIWEIVRTDDPGLGPAYVADRRAAISKFRETNRVALEQWFGGGPGTWSRFYAHEEHTRLWRWAFVAAALGVVLGVRIGSIHRRGSGRAALSSGLWLALVPLTLWLVHQAVLGDLDYTVINLKARYVPRAFLVTFVSALAGIGVHRFAFGRSGSLVRDLMTAAVMLVVADLGHILVYGWPIGFPLPSAAARYFPFFGSIAAVGYAIVTLVAALVVRVTPSSPAPSTLRPTGRRS